MIHARILFLFAFIAALAHAHNGPPFPILTNHRIGPCIVSLWAHPDVGTGLFFVVVSPAPGQTIPKDLQFKLGVLPVSGRLKEIRYRTEPVRQNGEIRYSAWPQFDRQEPWRVNLYLISGAGEAQASTTVEVTPPGFGGWDLLFFSLPFLALGLLWFMGLQRKKKRASQRAAASR